MRQQPNFYRLDRAPGGAGRERPEGAPSPSMMVPLPPNWLCLQDCNLSGQLNQPVVVPFVLMHPHFGVALIDVAPVSNPDAEAVFRRRLESARFESIFPGYLPVLHLRLDRADLPSTEAILRDAFAALPPLSLPGGDGWVSVVRRALLPRDPTRAAAHPVLPPEHVHQRPSPRRAQPAPNAAEAETEADMLRREPPSHPAAAKGFAETDSPDPPIQPNSSLPWIIMSGVGGLIAVLALVGLLNTGSDALRDAAEETATASAPAAPAPAPPPAAPSLAATPAPSPAPTPVPAPAPAPASSSKPPAAMPPPPVPPAAALPPAPPPPIPPSASAATGAPAAPAPAQRPAATAAERLPQVTVREPSNLRAAPNGQANVIRVVPRGETFRVHGRTPNGWVHVGDAEPRGWLHTSRLGEIE